MAENREVAIRIDDSFTAPVCNHSVGFLRLQKFGKVETATPSGTGTFVRQGKVYGILTAGHVLKPMGKSETVGLIRFPTVQPPLQNFRLNLAHTARIVDWNGKDCDAPDIAFLKIPEIDARNLEAAGGVFYNLNATRQYQPAKPENRMSKAAFGASLHLLPPVSPTGRGFVKIIACSAISAALRLLRCAGVLNLQSNRERVTSAQRLVKICEFPSFRQVAASFVGSSFGVGSASHESVRACLGCGFGRVLYTAARFYPYRKSS